jgi:hypothetical protein
MTPHYVTPSPWGFFGWSVCFVLLAGSLVAGLLAHTRADDRVRAELRRMQTEDVADALCWRTVQGVNAHLDAMACACWIPTEGE